MTARTHSKIEPRVLYIDDNPKQSRTVLQGAAKRLSILDLSKAGWDEEFAARVADADIVVSDFKFEQNVAVGGRLPPDGQVMNETVRALRRDSPPIVAIYSAKLDTIPGTSGTNGSPQQLARALNAAFVGDKNQSKVFANRLHSMVGAVRTIYRLVGRNKPLTESQITTLLKLPEAAKWRDEAMRGLDLSRLPIHLKGNSAVTTFADAVNWIVRDVLPYPGVFVDTWNLAIALRLQPKWLARRLAGDPLLLKESPFDSTRYKGILSDFYGQRWWTAGVDHTLWKVCGGVRDSDALANLARKWLGGSIRQLEHRSPVLEVNEFGVPTGEVIEAGDAVRIMPVGWPATGPWPWMSRKNVENDPVSKALALPDDLRAAGLV